jgi:hypothetical protein
MSYADRSWLRRGKGLVSKTHTGDLFAVIKIVMPPKPDEKAREIWLLFRHPGTQAQFGNGKRHCYCSHQAFPHVLRGSKAICSPLLKL